MLIRRIFINLILCIVLCIQSTVVTVCADENEIKEYSSETLEITKKVLNDLNMWFDYDETDSCITRAELLAIIVTKLNGVSETYVKDYYTHHVYADVPNSHWINPLLNYADMFLHDMVGTKCMGGDGNGNFRPDDYVSYQEFIKVIITYTMWSRYVTEQKLVYPDGYWTTSKLLGINPFGAEKMMLPIKESDAMVILYYALCKPSLSYMFSTNPYESTLSYKKERFVRGYAKRIDGDAIVIDGYTYYGKVDDENFVEGNVLCIYDDQECRKIVSCYPISSLDFDNPQPINEALLNWQYIVY